jgi:biopolymer transport protein ExbB
LDDEYFVMTVLGRITARSSLYAQQEIILLIQGFTFLLKGGPVMWPLFLCAVLSITVIIERLLAQSSISKESQGLVSKVSQALLQGNVGETEHMLAASSGPVAKVLLVGIRNRDLRRDQLEHLMEEVAIDEIPPLSRGLGVLDTIITVAPLLGLLGTVTGMIKAFQIVAVTAGGSAPSKITGGVAEALIATATGLVIAIVTLVGYNHLSGGVKQIVSAMESAATKIVNLLERQRDLTSESPAMAGSRDR